MALVVFKKAVLAVAITFYLWGLTYTLESDDVRAGVKYLLAVHGLLTTIYTIELLLS